MTTPDEPLGESAVARRRPTGAKDASAVLNAAVHGYLSLEILFLGEPVEGLEIKFFDSDGQIWAGKTDQHGICQFGGHSSVQVEAGVYECEVENETQRVRVTTVEHPDRPFVLLLPIGRPLMETHR